MCLSCLMIYHWYMILRFSLYIVQLYIRNINVYTYIYMCIYIIFHIEYCYHCAGSVRVSSKGQPPSFQCSRLPAKRERRSPSCQEKARPVGSVVFLPAYFHQKTAQGLRDICNILLNVLYIVLEYISTSYTDLVIGISLYILCYTYTL